MKPITTTVYEANDGSHHATEAECLEYEAKLIEEEKNTTYVQVVSNPDLTEGRGYNRLMCLRVRGLPHKYLEKELIEDWCYRQYGRPVDFVMGVGPVTSWFVSPSDRAQWVSAGNENSFDRPYVRSGDYKSYAKQISLIMGPGESGLIKEELE